MKGTKVSSAQNPASAAAAQQSGRQEFKCAAPAYAGNDCHQARQQAQHPQIDVSGIGSVRRDRQHGGGGTEGGDAQNGFLLEKCTQTCGHGGFLP